MKLIQERRVTVAQAARERGPRDPQQAFPGQEQLKPEQLETEQLRREVTKLKAERDTLKKAAVGSSDQRNTIWGKVALEGDRDGTHGASGLVCGPDGAGGQPMLARGC